MGTMISSYTVLITVSPGSNQVTHDGCATFASFTRYGFAFLLRPYGSYVRRLGPALRKNRKGAPPVLPGTII